MKKPKPVLRFRHNSAITVAAVIAIIGGISVASWQPYLLALLVVPIGIAAWAWRSGTDVDADGLTVRAALGRRRLPWPVVTGLVPAGRQVFAVLGTGGRVALAAVSPADLPKLVAATGHPLDSPGSAPTPVAGTGAR